MNPYARFSASAALTLAIWGPHAVSSIRNNHVDLSHSAGRFLVVFIASRFAVRWISTLLLQYRDSARFDVRTAIDASPVLSGDAKSSGRTGVGESADRRRRTGGRATDPAAIGANVIEATNNGGDV